MSCDPQALLNAAKALNAAVSHDDSNAGGLLSRQTIRKADELRIAIARFEADQKREPSL